MRCIFRPAGLPRPALHFSTGVHKAIAKTRNDAKNKTLAFNAHGKILERIGEDLGEPLKKLVTDVQHLLDEHLAPIDDQTRDVLDSLKGALDTLEDKTHDIKSLL